MFEVTQILDAIGRGDPQAPDELLPLVYEELRRLAAHRLSHEAPGQTLDATALVHEAYLRLVDVGEQQPWSGRGHFFAAAAEAMRRILVDRARRKKRARHGGHHHRVELDVAQVAARDGADELLAVHETLDELQQHDPQVATLVKLRYFVGLPHGEAAAALGVSRRTADRLWAVGRTWMYQRLSEDRI